MVKDGANLGKGAMFIRNRSQVTEDRRQNNFRLRRFNCNLFPGYFVFILRCVRRAGT